MRVSSSLWVLVPVLFLVACAKDTEPKESTPLVDDDEQDGEDATVDDDCGDLGVGLRTGNGAFVPTGGSISGEGAPLDGEVVLDTAGTLIICGGTHPVHLRVKSDDITIVGVGPEPAVLDGTASGSVLRAEGVQGLKIDNVVVTGGLAELGGGVWLDGSEAELTSVVFVGNEASSETEPTGLMIPHIFERARPAGTMTCLPGRFG